MLHHQESFPVRVYDTDWRGLLTLSRLFDFLQETASHHAERLGLGFEALRDQGRAWVLSRIAVQWLRVPAWAETVRVTTWPSGMDRLFAHRDYLVADDAGEPVAAASSAWLLLDWSTKRPVRVTGLMDLPAENLENRALPVELRKVETVPGGTVVDERTVRGGDLDLNRHVNNARYVAWLEDAVTTPQDGRRVIGRLEANFLGEAAWGERIRIAADALPGQAPRRAAFHRNGEVLFTAALAWAELGPDGRV